METAPQTHPATIADWQARDESTLRGRNCELVEGVLVEGEMPRPTHGLVEAWLAQALWSWVTRQRGLLSTEVDLVLGPGHGRVADVAVWVPRPPGALDLIGATPPKLVVEVLSPSLRDHQRDRVEKAAAYARWGVRHYWLLDPTAHTFEAFLREATTRYVRHVAAAQGTVTVPGFPELVLDLDACWAAIA